MVKKFAGWTLIVILALSVMLVGCAAPIKRSEPKQLGKEKVKSLALWTACRECNVPAVKKLLDAGVELNDPFGPKGTTALMECVRSYDNKCPAEMVKMLIEAGAEVNQQDMDGLTALHYSAAYNCGRYHLESLKALLENGADPGILTRELKTPLQLAAEVDCADKITILAEYIKTYYQELDNLIPDPTQSLLIPPEKVE